MRRQSRHFRTISRNNPHVRYQESPRHRDHCAACRRGGAVMFPFITRGRAASKRAENARLRENAEKEDQ